MQGNVVRSNPAAAPAAGYRFATVVGNQMADVVLNGIYSSYRCKLWAMEQRRSVSLGTVGKERDWRNKQRRARNKARSRADVSTLNMLVVIRWVQEVSARASDWRARRRKARARLGGVARRGFARRLLGRCWCLAVAWCLLLGLC